MLTINENDYRFNFLSGNAVTGLFQISSSIKSLRAIMANSEDETPIICSTVEKPRKLVN
tara:strand:- start:294 stop:470 length:177 start_codon:yes stop_codon:yes gene_type:complete